MQVVVHTREAAEDTLAILKDCMPQDAYIDIHCFTGVSVKGKVRRGPAFENVF